MATTTKESFKMEDNEFLDAGSVHIFPFSTDLEEFAVNAQEVIDITGATAVRNAIFRGKYLGTSFTQTQYNEIVAGTFDDLYLGDYWTIDGINWRIWHFDYNTGDSVTFSSQEKYSFGHNIVIMPDECFVKGSSTQESLMDDTDTTENGFLGTKMRTQYLWTGGDHDIFPALEELFGEGRIKSHYTTYTKNYVDGETTTIQRLLTLVSVPYPSQVTNGVYFSRNFAPESMCVYHFSLSALTQRYIFAKRPNGTYEDYWTRSIANDVGFRKANGDQLRFSGMNASSRSDILGIRPYFTIGEVTEETEANLNLLSANPRMLGLQNAAPKSNGANIILDEINL